MFSIIERNLGRYGVAKKIKDKRERNSTHDELIEKRGIYYTLHELQFQDSAVAAELMGDSTEINESVPWQPTEDFTPEEPAQD